MIASIFSYLIDRHHVNRIVDRVCLKLPSVDCRELQILSFHCCCARLWVSRRVHGQLASLPVPEELVAAGSFTPYLLFFSLFLPYCFAIQSNSNQVWYYLQRDSILSMQRNPERG